MTLTDEQLAEIRERLETLEKGGSLCGGWEGFVWASAPATDIRALLDEVERLRASISPCDICGAADHNLRANRLEGEVIDLRHDVTRHMEIANDRLTEIERLQSHITAARSFRVLNENAQADRHLSEAMGFHNAKPSKMTVDVDNG